MKKVRFRADPLKLNTSLGRIIVEILHEDLTFVLNEQDNRIKGVSDEFLKNFKIMDDEENNIVPISKGIVKQIPKSAFGKAYIHIYGEDACEEMKKMKVGDVVCFVNQQSHKVDKENTHHIINDDHALGFWKSEDVFIEEVIDPLKDSKLKVL